MATENRAGVRDMLRRSLDEPEAALSSVPALLAALEDEDPQLRVGAAWAICSVALEHPAAAPDLRDELADRSSSAAELAATWIDRELGAQSTASGERRPSSTDGSATDGSVTDDSTGDGSIADDPTGDGSTGGTSESTDGSSGSAHGSKATDADSESADSGSADSESAESEAAGSESADADTTATRTEPAQQDAVVRNGRFTIELERTAFEGLEIVDRVASDRHSWTYAGIATVDARRHAVLVRSFRPPEGARLATFGAAFADVLERWAGVDDHDGVLTLYDYGRRPHPWAVLAHVPATLRTTGALPVPAALRVGHDAATALAHAHERGVTHRSLDPRSLAIDRRGDRPAGRLLNFGVVDAFRAADGPMPMDSRYCPPELFDDEFGAIDRLSDVYQLGAVLYTALTGRPPYEDSLVGCGGPAGVPLDPPSAVEGAVPEAVDGIVETAMATHKIARYESAHDLAVDLERAIEAVGTGDDARSADGGRSADDGGATDDPGQADDAATTGTEVEDG